ncbi:CHASE2 domain-containing protein [Dyella sp. A6]|uniref:CHASE2 domain-containing protein n=1 Tax=Dyella aluminiiresistens TaxID=3069105 RepID=UPI002E7A4825|nr:CHASE2 domain-containing protein [Dyella sp. A6]
MLPRGFAWLVRGAVWLVATGLLALLLTFDATGHVDSALYDINMRHWTYTPGNDVVIVAIDPSSLTKLGRWPFPRLLHARLINRLTDDGVRAIGLDITMTTPDAAHPAYDKALASALRRNGHVVMPVFAEPTDLGGTLEEMLPVPGLAREAAAFGQVDVDESTDGISRGVYLMAGLGQAYWPSLGLALYRQDHPRHPSAQLPGLRNPMPTGESPYLWIRDYYALLHYAGPSGTFGRVSYADVLDKKVPPSLLKGKTVLIGATAEGMRDIVRTPDGLMPGVEYQANILESLQRGLLLTPLGFTLQLVVGAIVLSVPCLLYGLPGFRRLWSVLLVGMLLPLASSLLLLRALGWWWPPTACVLTVAIAGAAWWLLVRPAGTAINATPA